VTEIDPHQNKIDSTLRHAMAASIPSLPSDFERRVLRHVRSSSKARSSYRQTLLIGYALASMLASAVVMRSQGLGWATIAGMTLAPLILAAVVRGAWRATHRTAPTA